MHAEIPEKFTVWGSIIIALPFLICFSNWINSLQLKKDVQLDSTTSAEGVSTIPSISFE